MSRRLARASRLPRGRSKRFVPGAAPVTLRDQSAAFGALTLAGAGGFQIVDSNGDAVTNVTDDGTGTASGYSLSAGGLITPSTDGSLSTEDGNTIDFSSDQGSATVTLDVIANGFSVIDIDELSSAFNNASLSYGDTIYCRGGTYNSDEADTRLRRTAGAFGGTLTWMSQHADPRQGYDYTTGNPVTITAHAGETATHTFLRIDGTEADNTGLRITGLTFTRTGEAAEPHNTSNGGALELVNGIEKVCVDNCIFDNAPGGFVFESEKGLRTGFRATQINQDIYAMDNTFRNVAIAINIGDGDRHVMVGNTCESAWEDWYKEGGGDDCMEAWNIVEQKDGLDFASPNDIHGDFSQIVGPEATITGLEKIGNRYIIGKTLEGTQAGQGFFQDNQSTGSRITNPKIKGNFVFLDLVRGFSYQVTDDAEVVWNTILGDPGNTTSSAKITFDQKQATIDQGQGVQSSPDILFDVANSIDPATATDVTQGQNDTSTDPATQSTYTDLFTDPKFAGNLTIANLLASYEPKAASAIDVAAHEPIIGAIPPSGRDGLLDYTNRITAFPDEKTGWDPTFTDLTGQSTSTAVSDTQTASGIEEPISGSVTGALVWIEGGNTPDFDILASDDSVIVSGVAVGKDNAKIIYNNQKLRVNDTTSASGGTTFNVTVHVGANADTWSHTTA